MKRVVIFAVFTCVIIFLACGAQREAAGEQQEAYVQDIESRLLIIEDDILALRERADNVLTKKRTQFEAQIDSLAVKHEAAEAKLLELREASAENWQRHKAEMESLMAELSRLKKNTRDW